MCEIRSILSVADAYFQKCLFEHAWPEPDFKYCSKSAAAFLEEKAI